mgnify:CR=1 FL=1
MFQDATGANFLAGAAPYYDTYRTKDHKYVAVGALVHTIISAFRAPRAAPGKGRVIEGEYIVVGRAGPGPAAGAGPIRIP